MKWTVKLVAEGRSSVEHEVITIERGESISPGTIGLTIAEAKLILEGLQRHVVASQVQEHNVAQRLCSQCGKAFRSKGYYQSTLRSVYGNVPVRVRRVKGCPCTGSQNHSYSVLFTNKYPVTPELKYLYGQNGCSHAVRQGGRLLERTAADVGRGERQYRTQSDHEGVNPTLLSPGAIGPGLIKPETPHCRGSWSRFGPSLSTSSVSGQMS